MLQQKHLQLVLAILSLVVGGLIYGGRAAAAPPPQSTDSETTSNRIESTKLGWTQYTNGNYVRDIAVDDEDILWAATGGGVVAWDPVTDEAIKFTTFDGLYENDSYAVTTCPMPEPSVVVGHAAGLSVFNLESRQWVETISPANSDIEKTIAGSLVCDADGGRLLVGYIGSGFSLLDIESREWETYSTFDSDLPSGIVYGLRVVDDRMWVGSQDGLAYLDSTGSITVHDLDETLDEDDYVRAIVVDDSGDVWLGGGEGLVQVSGGEWTRYNSDSVEDMPTGEVNGLALGPDGSLWVGYTFQVCRFDLASATCTETYGTRDGLPRGFIEDLAVDANGNFFLAYDGQGIAAFDGSQWRTLTLDEPVASNEFEAVAQDDNGLLWFATDSDGFHQLDQTNPITPWLHFGADSPEVPNLSINTFYVDPDGGVWIGHGSGVTFYDGQEWRFIFATEADAELLELDNPDASYQTGLVNEDITIITQDSEERMWLVANDTIHVWDGAEMTILLPEQEGGILPEYSEINAVQPDGDRVWVGTANGELLRLNADLEIEALFNLDNSNLQAFTIGALALDADGSLLVGADDRLVRWEDGDVTEEVFSTDSIYPGASSDITDITVTDRGDSWVSTRGSGLFHFDGQQWQHLTTADGLPSHSFVTPNLLVDDHGLVWMPADRGGLAVFNPSMASPETPFTAMEEALVNLDQEAFAGQWHPDAFDANLVGDSGLSGAELFEEAAFEEWYLQPDFQGATELEGAYIVPTAVWSRFDEEAVDEVHTALVNEVGDWLVLGVGEEAAEVEALVERYLAGESLEAN